jgi:hypothetical protein
MDPKHKILDKIYYSPASGAAYSSPLKFFKFLKKAGYDITFNDVKQYLLNQVGYQRTKQDASSKRIPKHLSRRFIQVNQPGSLALDTFYLNRLRTPYNYALVGIDMFSRRLYLKFLRQLNASTASRAFTNILKEVPKDYPVTHVFTDSGM